MRKLKVTRYKQKPAHCAVASCATVGNFYNSDINYENTQKVAKQKVAKSLDQGLDSGEIAKLLNVLGFNKVSVVTTNLHFLDYSWSNLTRSGLIRKLDTMYKYYRGDYKDVCKSLSKWLKLKEFDNNIIIDYNFGKYIRSTIDSGKPLMLSFNWTMYFKYKKQGELRLDPIKGEFEEHAVVAYGYDSKGVFICDSHHQLYKNKLKEYKSGKYKISWENLMTVMGFGDLYIPEEYERQHCDN